MLHAIFVTSVIEKEESCDKSGDWWQPIKESIREPCSTRERKLCQQDLKYRLVGDELYRRTVDGILLKCLDEEQP
jgi:hypothetical protein